MELAALSNTPLVPSLAPPTQVPLRTTQASTEMRKMMGVFRLNPFSMHNGSSKGVSSSAWYGEDIGPLEEEPVTFEFQLDLHDGIAKMEFKGEETLRSFSPDFEDDAVADETSRTDGTDTESDLNSFSGVSMWTYTPPTTFIPATPSTEDAASIHTNSRPSSGDFYFSLKFCLEPRVFMRTRHSFPSIPELIPGS
jgi:hypothetical protein